MKPIIKYPGGKSRELLKILPYVPANIAGRYVEPFFGGGALYFHLEPERAIINDTNERVMNFYSAIRDEYEDVTWDIGNMCQCYNLLREKYEAVKSKVVEELRIEDEAEEFYYQMRDLFNGKGDESKFWLHSAAIYYFINRTAYAGIVRTNTKGEFNVPYGRYKGINPHYVTEGHSNLLKTATIMRGDYGKVFDVLEKDDFVFLDPPYDSTFTNYANGSDFTREQHVELANKFKNLPCRALMVIGKTDFIEGLYKGYIKEEYAKKYAVNIKNRMDTNTTHLIITNYEL